MPRTIFSFAEPYFAAAREELSARFPGAKIERLGAEVGSIEAARVAIGDVAAACHAHQIVFLRHLMEERARIPLTDAADDPDLVYDALLELLRGAGHPRQLAVQVWADGSSGDEASGDQPSPANKTLMQRILKLTIAGLTEQGITVTRADQEQTLSVCLAARYVLIGLNRRADALADWPGGRVHLAKRGGQLARSEFKLEEAVKIFDLTFPAHGTALDLGASPGGWTRLLRERGLTVWAVDPGDLEGPIVNDPSVHHARTTAGAFLAQNKTTFDLIVNDMRIMPELSCETMLQAAVHVKDGSLGVMTLKLSLNQPVKTVLRCLGILEPTYEVLHARQLFHNRQEVMVVLRRPE
jgi:23S rRNA (cytidine2498-2'-O)-methyltransferase